MLTAKVKAIDNSWVAQFSQMDRSVQDDYLEKIWTILHTGYSCAFYGYVLAHITTCWQALCVSSTCSTCFEAAMWYAVETLWLGDS